MEKSEILLKPGQHIKPYVPNEVIQELRLKLYNLKVTSVEELNSYDDINFHIMVKKHGCLPDTDDMCHNGKILCDMPYTKDLFFEVGKLVAKTELALMGFAHDGIKGVDRIWNLNAVPMLSDFVYVINDEEKHKLAMEVIDNSKSHVLPHLQQLESGPIPGDFNE